MTEEYGGPYGTCEGREIRHDVVDGGDERLIHDMGDSYDDAAREGHGQEKSHHGKQSDRIPQRHLPPTMADEILGARVQWGGGGSTSWSLPAWSSPPPGSDMGHLSIAR